MDRTSCAATSANKNETNTFAGAYLFLPLMSIASGNGHKLERLKRVKMKERNEKLSMEKYLEFFASRKQSDLKVEFLNQIISMHGYKRLKLPKSALSEAVSSIDLMNPLRSTLKENIAPAVTGTLNDVMRDLNDLTWQECFVTSIKVLNSRQAEGIDCVPVSASTSSLNAGVEIGEKTNKSVPKRKRSVRGIVGLIN